MVDSSPARRFPTPWTVHNSDGSYWLQDAEGKKFAFCYFQDRSWIGTGGNERLSRDEARRLVSNFAKLPALLGRK
jgi:hypothetical protein